MGHNVKRVGNDQFNRSPLDLGWSRVRTLNVSFDAVTQPEAADYLIGLIGSGTRGWVSTINVTSLVLMRSNSWFQQFVDASLLTVADGQPLIWLSRRFGTPLPERVTGIELIDDLCQRAACLQHRVFLLGATTEIVERTAHRLAQAHPGLLLSWSNGYFSDLEAADRAHEVAQSGAKILFVGMGAPQQERFMENHWEQLGVAVAIGVGGSFDVLSGEVSRAPQLLQTLGLEWTHRIRKEPRRLFPRYLKTGWIYLLLSSRAIVLKSFRHR
jgi:N-acetylglucosaminyldiphosphoundecaprenol N-acetyl-beta-D-mannosaminyltransferase